MKRTLVLALLVSLAIAPSVRAQAPPEREITPESEEALERGLEWLAANAGPEGNWECKDLGLVSMGALAFLSAGHAPGRGRYGRVVQKALDYVVENQKKSGLLNLGEQQRDMYNHGLSTFVLGQAHGMSTSQDRRLGMALEKAIKLIVSAQRTVEQGDVVAGGWGYKAHHPPDDRSDLSLAVMQTKALRSAMDSGFDVPEETVQGALRFVRACHRTKDVPANAPEAEHQKRPGLFCYQPNGANDRLAMSSAGVVCLQELAQYDDWRIPKNMDYISAALLTVPNAKQRNGQLPADAYGLYYAAQAIYQHGGEPWQKCYPKMRDFLVKSQIIDRGNPAKHGMWIDSCPGEMQKFDCAARVGGRQGELYGTSVACFVLAIPNRYLPILQRNEGIKQKFGAKP